ncbi:MAG: LytTR family DNA-binding domain-containing protein [Gemmatimonadaceae bacterium]
MSIRAIIVDDEKLARSRIARLLGTHPAVHIVSDCAGGLAAVEVIEREQPDLVFLDVQMPDIDGFEVLKRLSSNAMPHVIFVTAYDHYALRAFEASAIDYLLKPYTTRRFSLAVERAISRIGSAHRIVDEERLRGLLRDVLREERPSSIPASSSSLDRFVVKREGTTQLVKAADVDWIESDGNYVRLHTGATSHLVRGTISSFEDSLDSHMFVRVHRRYMVNIDRIREVQPWFGGDYVVILKTGQQVKLSRTHREAFDERIRGR